MKLDTKLLKHLYEVVHPSNGEVPMINFILNYIKNLPNLYYEIDDNKNLFIIKNTTDPEYYPCVVAHMDENQTYFDEKTVVFKDGRVYGKYKNLKQQCGLGADDSSGICCALQLLKVISDLKVCFTVEEEIGAFGAIAACDNFSFWYNVSYMLQADRHGANDLIVYTNGIKSASDDFLKDIADLIYTYNYEPERGLFTDVGELANNLLISGVNISCGYYHEHTSKEYVVLSELENCLNFMFAILKKLSNLDRSYDIKITPASYFPGYDEEFFNNQYDFMRDSSKKTVWDLILENDYEFKPEYPCSQCTIQNCLTCPYDAKFFSK